MPPAPLLTSPNGSFLSLKVRFSKGVTVRSSHLSHEHASFYFYLEIMFTIISILQEVIKGVGIKVGGWKIFQKFISRRGDDDSVLESTWKFTLRKQSGLTPQKFY